MKLYFKNFEIYHNISIYLFYFLGAAAEPLGSARGALRAPRSTGWEPLLYIFRALCAHHQEVKIVLYSIWYHHTCRWPSGATDGH